MYTKTAFAKIVSVHTTKQILALTRASVDALGLINIPLFYVGNAFFSTIIGLNPSFTLLKLHHTLRSGILKTILKNLAYLKVNISKTQLKKNILLREHKLIWSILNTLRSHRQTTYLYLLKQPLLLLVSLPLVLTPVPL